MPSLAELTDYYPQQQDNTLPVESVVPDVDGIRRVIINAPTKAAPDGLPDVGNGVLEQPFFAGNSTVNKIVDRLTGMNGEERYQLWPEKVVREALSAAHDTYNSEQPITSQDLIAPAQAMSALAGSGGLGGTGAEAGAVLGSSPFLRPALKYENKIYKAPVGGQHLDALPEHLADMFQKQAMSGEDISNFNFGFMNHKGQFLDREKALDYAIKEGLLDPHAGQYGALTSTLLADSSKPGTAIEAMAKAKPNYVYHSTSPNNEASIAKKGLVNENTGIYFAPNKKMLKAWHNNGNIIYRIDKNKIKNLKNEIEGQSEETNSLLSYSKIPSLDLEISKDDGKTFNSINKNYKFTPVVGNPFEQNK